LFWSFWVKKILIILVVVLFSPLMVEAGERKSLDPNWMTYYYFHQEGGSLDDFLLDTEFSEHVMANPSVAKPLAAFLSEVFSKDHELAKAMATLDFSSGVKSAVARSFWLARKDKLIIQLLGNTPEWSKQPPPSLSDLIVKSPADLDMLWGAFMASGEPVYIKKILAVLDDDKSLTGNELQDKLIRSSAQWSLGSNMMQHEKVNRIVKSEVDIAKGSLKESIEEIISKNAKKYKGLPNKVGDFSAFLLITDVAELKEFKKKSTKGLQFVEKKTVKRGEKVALKIIFSAMELSDDYNADVTFDLVMVDANGTVYNTLNLKDKVAMRHRTPVRYSIFNSAGYAILAFDKEDALGPYKITAKVYDNIAKKHIDLNKTLTLTE